MLTEFNPYAVYARVKSLGREDRLAVYLKLKLDDKQQLQVERRLQSEGPGKPISKSAPPPAPKIVPAAAPKAAARSMPAPPKPRVEVNKAAPPVQPPADEFSMGDDFSLDDTPVAKSMPEVDTRLELTIEEDLAIRDQRAIDRDRASDPDQPIDHDRTFDHDLTIDHPPPPPVRKSSVENSQADRSRVGPAGKPTAPVADTDDQPTMAAPPISNDYTPGQLEDYKHISLPGFDLIRKIGDGGQAIVFLATQQSTGRRVAVKLLRDGPLAHESSRERHLREIRILASLNHPNIVGIIDSGRTETGIDYLVMEYIEGESLDEFMRGYHRPDAEDPAAVIRLFIKICEAVNSAHRRGVVHRDLSPSNIRVDEKGEPHILDFGLARTAFDRFMQPDGRDISVSGQFLGKLAYASPEQARGESAAVDIRTDVYALGVMLYQTLTGGRFPYVVVGNIRDVLDNIVNIQPAPPSKVIDPGTNKKRPPRRKTRLSMVNPVIEGIVLKALAKNPIKRHQSAGELARDLETYLSGGQIDGHAQDERRWNLRRLFGWGE